MQREMDLKVAGVNWPDLDESAQAALRPLIEAGVLVTYVEEGSETLRLTFAGSSVPRESRHLREFISANAEFLAWRQRLHARASLWRLGGQPAELLLPEEDTRVALRWKAERQPEFSAVEMAFIDESLKSQQTFTTIVRSAAAPGTGTARSASQSTTGTGEFARMFQTAPAAPAPPAPAEAAPSAPLSSTSERPFVFPAAQSPAPPPFMPPPPAQTVQDVVQGGGVAVLPAAAPKSHWLRWLGLAAGVLLVLAAVAYLGSIRQAQVGSLPAVTATQSPEDRARVALAQNRYGDAVELYTQAIKGGKPLLAERAYAHRLAGNLTAAIQDYDAAILSGAADDQIFSDAAYTFSLIQKPEQAIGYLTKGIHRSPSNARLRVDRANAYMTTKDYRPALADFENALRIDPTSAAAQAGRIAALKALRLPVGGDDAPPRVYIQITSEVQRDLARHLQDSLKDQGYQTPGIEFIQRANLKQNELRYVSSQDRAQAERLAVDLRKSGVELVVVQVKGNVARLKHFEIWLAPPGETDSKKPPPQQYQRAL